MIDYEQKYEEFWKELVETDGKPDMDKIKRELFDYARLMDSASKIIDAITDTLSKPNSDPDLVIDAYESKVERLIAEAIEDYKESEEDE